jgi:YD repeat-containing protein
VRGQSPLTIITGAVWSESGYFYDDPAHVHAATRVFTGGQYSYDANGNMTSRVENGQVYAQSFDAENRLVQVVAGGSLTTTYAYNAEGAMVRRVRPDCSSTLYAGLVEYELNAAGSEVSRTSYINVPGARVVRTGTGAGTVSWVLTDHLGSSSVTTDSNGNTVGELRYEAYGATRWSTGSMPTDRLYTGQRLEMSGTGLYYFNARW